MGLAVTSLVLGEFSTNCYLTWCPQTLEAFIIDPADSGETITQKILELQLQPQAIILTHGHFDHVLASLELKLTFGIPVLIHSADLPLLKRAHQSAEHWLKHSVDPIPAPDGMLDTHSTLCVGTHQLQVIETPGHTPGSICLYYQPSENETRSEDAGPVEENLPLESRHRNDQFIFSETPLLFSGDTLFRYEIGSVKHRYSRIFDLHQSLRCLSTLPPATTVLPGHGEPTSIAAEHALLKPSTE